MYLIQRPCYQRGSLCKDPVSNGTTQRPPDHHKEMQTAMVWSRLLFIRSGQNHLVRHSERGQKQGRQRKRWEDNIREWTGLEFTKSQRALENRGLWRKLVAKSSVMPQWPSRLRDRWSDDDLFSSLVLTAVTFHFISHSAGHLLHSLYHCLMYKLYMKVTTYIVATSSWRIISIV